MIKILTLFVLFFAISQTNSAFAQEKDIPKLQNPFTESYLRDNLKQSKPRMIYNEKIVEDLKVKIKSDPVIKNMYKAIKLAAYKILDTTVINRIKTTNAMLDVSRELLRRVEHV